MAPQYIIKWQHVKTFRLSDRDIISMLSFEDAAYDGQTDFLPLFYTTLNWDKGTPTSVSLKNTRFQSLTDEERTVLNSNRIGKDITPDFKMSYYKGKPRLKIVILPFRINPETGTIEKLYSFDLSIGKSAAPNVQPEVQAFGSASRLASGEWYKIGVTEDGVYKVGKELLQSLGVDVTSVDPNTIGIYGNGGGALPFDNSVWRPDDLRQLAIRFVGDGDAVFENGEYFLFYGQAQTRWTHPDTVFAHNTNRYSDTSYYFISPDAGSGKWIAQRSSAATYNQTVMDFDEHLLYENDLVNLIKSGRQWYGESFGIVTDYNFTFSIPDIVTGSEVVMQTAIASRTIGANSTWTVDVNNGHATAQYTDQSMSTDYTSKYADPHVFIQSFTEPGATIKVGVSLNKGNSSATGWLDYIEINAKRALTFSGDQMIFRNYDAYINGSNARFVLSNMQQDNEVWDVTDQANVMAQQGSLNGNVFSFNVVMDTLHEFIAFNGDSYLQPVPFGRIANQNIHGVTTTGTKQPEMVIVTHPKFLAEANDLAAWHRNNDNIDVLVVTTQQVYNEFSSGARDITAIKDMMRMFYERAGTDSTLLPLYLLLFGDGSYDNKGASSANSNFIPTYQSSESWWPTQSYTTDDYYGLLDPGESDKTNEDPDIGIGRLIVSNVQQARDLVAKIKHYRSSSTLKSWRSWVCFVGDDEDGWTHMWQADSLANRVDTAAPSYNIDKIYFDAYPQVSTPGGDRYPEVNDAIDNRMNSGALIMTYVGHGGELGWGHERVLEVGQINKWENLDNMPLFLTATCEFSRYDDPARTSAGEYTLLNPNGGAIGLLTTTRLVYSSPNYELAKIFFNNTFKDFNGQVPTMGDLCLVTKINGPPGVNLRNFTLLGDPALKLAYPKYSVVTDATPDTLHALDKVTVKGHIEDDQGNLLQSFNGRIYPVVFDKPAKINALNNDQIGGSFSFYLQKNALFKGKASVTNGRFTFSFIVPKDIVYSYGKGRISYYAEDGSEDAIGVDESIIIGGQNDNYESDNTGPVVKLFMNDNSFVSGGMTDENPDIYSELFDEHGINTIGSGIGHDITAILDANTGNSMVLNDYYEADLDSYQSGKVRYPLNNLAKGKHTLTMKAWDVYNNSGTGYTEFFVAESAELALDHVLNYPNPFTTHTDFYFEHNHPGELLNVRIQIFTVSGKLVKTLDAVSNSDGYRVGPISWDGLDEYGDAIGKGVYIYKVEVLALNGDKVSEFEKLVLLN